MKITIDTSITPHRVEVEGECTIGEIADFLSRYYGNDEWRKVIFSAKAATGLHFAPGYRGNDIPWVQPIHIPCSPSTQPWPNTPWRIGDLPPGTITYCSDTNSFTNSAGNNITFTAGG